MIKKLIAIVTMSCTLFTTNISYAATIKANDEEAKYSSDSLESSSTLKVKVNDDGELSYQLPVGKTALEVESEKGKWGDKVYSEDRIFSWDNVNMYFVMNDRFVNGDISNDHSYGRGEGVSDYSTRYGYFHGGDLKGLTSKIEDGYFDNLGTDAIWITAPYEQIHGALSSSAFKHYAYHGYYALDYTEVDKNMGTAEDLEEFIDTAHTHGIRVVFDIVMNHAGYANPYDANEFGYGALTSNWKEIYSWNDSKYKWFNDYAGEAEQNGSEGMMDTASGDWETNWWGSKWVRMVEGRFTAYGNQAQEGADVKTCVSGLPDFVTEGTEDPGMPGILKKKWDASKLAKEEQELNDFCKNYGMSKNVTTYLVKWLTDWVREYGVDGFRCDTAKHVETSVWGELSKAGTQALNEWRENNPDKPGAKWTDDFWMTGECWGHGVGKDAYYTVGGFESMINFAFQGNESKTGVALEGTYSDYAKQINNDDSFNALSYISSHDKGLGARSANAGTALLLCPGGVQTYYGDETGRKGDGAPDDQASRSNMNWDSIDQKILSNWQKIGQFRTEHLAVGAGQHKELSAEPYTFSRVYEKGDVKDKVVISLLGKSGTYTVECSDTFEDGATVIDYYTGQDYDVSDGKVEVTAGENGVVLLSEGKPSTKASIGLKAEDGKVTDGKFYDDSINLTLSLKKAESGTYSINGGVEKEFVDGDTFTIGKDAEVNDVITIEVKATGSNDEEKQEVSKVYTYKKAKVLEDSSSKAEGLTIHAKNTKWQDKESMNIWAYDKEKVNVLGTAAKWPGESMTKDSNGWFTINYPKATGDYYIILTSSKDRSVPEGTDDPMQAGESWYLDGTWYNYNPEMLNVGSITTDKYRGTAGEETNFTVKASGSGTLSYEFFNDSESIGKSDDGKLSWTPKEDGVYRIKAVVTDDSNNTESATMTYVVGSATDKPTDKPVETPDDDEDELEDLVVKTLKADKNQIILGETVKVTAETENEDGDVVYKFESEDGTKQAYSSKNTFIYTPEKIGTYKVTVTAKDDRDEEVSKSIKITVNEEDIDDDYTDKEEGVRLLSFKTVQNSPQIAGKTITLKATVSDGIGNVSYKFYANGKQINKGLESKSTYEWTPSASGSYDLRVEVTDESDDEVRDENVSEILGFEIIQKDEFVVGITSDVNTCKVGEKVIFKLSTLNADDDVSYEVTIDGQKQKVSQNNTVEWMPEEEGEYTIKVKATTDSGSVAEAEIKKFKVEAKSSTDADKDNNGEDTKDNNMAALMIILAGISIVFVLSSKKKKQI